MRDALLNYGLFASFGVFAVAGWMTASALSGGAIPGAGHGADASVTGPLAVSCALLAVHCLHSLVWKGRKT